MQSGSTSTFSSHPAPASIAPRANMLVYVLLLFLFVIWSNSFHAIAYFRRTLSVGAMDLLTLRYGLVVPFCLVYCLLCWRKFGRLVRQDGWRILIVGLLSVPGYNLTLNWGQARVPPATASLLIATNPIFTYLLAMFLLDERPRWAKIIGLTVSFLGVYGLLRVQHGQFGGGYVVYALVVLIAPACWALATVIGKPLTARHDPLLFTYAATGVGSLPSFIALAAGAGETHQVLASMNATGWIALLHLSILCTILGFAIWFWALRHLPASSVAAFVFLNPPLTLLFGLYWSTEVFNWTIVVFGLLILGGVALSSEIFSQLRRRR
ncbi:DMT family transporter [Candidatus Eisenbacteria bacterium]|uniref:DMT family transporter n=1 Tax=Eiseniibacteriota bacterium TaxID=2212470 RepID=A0ABV6YJ22_UNCEI